MAISSTQMTVPFLDLSAQYREIRDDVLGRVEEVIGRQSFILGPAVEGFEAQFAEFCETAYAFGVNSGTSALHLALVACGIETGLHYPVPIHLQPAMADLGYRRGDFPVTEDACSALLSLPMYAELTAEQVEYVASAVRECHGC